jgi:hypothetical protein
MLLVAVAATFGMLNPKPGEEGKVEGPVPFVFAALAAWWILRAVSGSQVRRALHNGHLRGDLTGPYARLARAWILCEAISTIIPGSSIIGPPLLVASVHAHAAAARAALARAAIQAADVRRGDTMVPGTSDPPIVGVPRANSLAQGEPDSFRAESRWQHQRVS